MQLVRRPGLRCGKQCERCVRSAGIVLGLRGREGALGTARMVEFARATVEPPKLLLLDEPASGLHSDEVARLGEQIMAIRSETGCTVLLVEHNAGFVMQHCDRVVVLALGSVLADGFPSEIQNDAAVRSAYLGEVVSEGSSAEAGS